MPEQRKRDSDMNKKVSAKRDQSKNFGQKHEAANLTQHLNIGTSCSLALPTCAAYAVLSTTLLILT